MTKHLNQQYKVHAAADYYDDDDPLNKSWRWFSVRPLSRPAAIVRLPGDGADSFRIKSMRKNQPTATNYVELVTCKRCKGRVAYERWVEQEGLRILAATELE